MIRIKNILLFLVFIIFISGCSVKGYKYKPDYSVLSELNDNNLKQMVVKKDKKSDVDESIPLRAKSMVSPYGGTFSKYLEISLEEQLKLASLYNKKSSVEISTELLINKINTITGKTDLSAKFIVKENMKIKYEKIHTIRHKWETSFLGQIAIQNAMISYPIAIQKLINKLLKDDDFLKATKR